MASFVARRSRAIDSPADAPGAPTGVEVAVEGTAGSQLIVWSAPESNGTAENTGYVVQWKSGDESFDNAADDERQASTSDLSWNTPAALEKGTEYTFRVAAVNEVGNSEWSSQASGTPGTTPGTVGEFKVAPGNASGTLVLTWVAPEDDSDTPITGYGVRWGTGRATPSTADVENGSATTYTITGLTTGVSYWVEIRAVNGAGNGEYVSPADAAQRTVTPTTSVASGSVRIGLPSAQSTGDEQAAYVAGRRFWSLSWRRPTLQRAQNLKEYHIQRRCGKETWPTAHPTTTVPDDGTYTQTPVTPARAFVSLVDAGEGILTGGSDGLTNGVECEIRVRAVTWLDRGSTDLGTQATDGTERDLVGAWVTGKATPLGVPGAPTFAVEAANNALNVSWSTPMTDDTPAKVADGGTPITGYEIAWASGGPVGDAEVAATATSYVITGLTNGVGYDVRVRAKNAWGLSPSATDASIAGTPLAVPGAPTNVRVSQPAAPATGQNDLRGTQLIVSWNAPASNGTGAITGYVVERRTSADPTTTPPTPPPGETWTAVAHSGTGTMVIDDIAETDRGTSYDYRVRARNGTEVANLGPWSDTGSGTAAALPSPVTQANIEIIPGNRSLTLTWTPAAGNGSAVTHYLVRYVRNETGRESWSSQARVPASALPTYTITGLANGVPYAVEITAVNDVGSSTATTTGGNDRPTSVRPAPTTVTAAPLGTDDNTDGDMLTVTWSAVTGAVGYVVEYLTAASSATPPVLGNPAAPWTPVDPTGKTPPVDKTVGDDSVATFDATKPRMATIGSLSEGETYVVRVRAVTQALLGGVPSGNALLGLPGFSDPVKAAATPATAPTVATPTQVPKTRTVRVTWTPSANAVTEGVTGYKITWYPTSAAVRGNSGSASVDADARSHDITGLSAVGQAITIIVTPVNDIGDGTEATVSHTLTAPSS